ncbi:MAG: bifunctional folylpolyglutamate synthase/dihydrofolate synthase [Christensenellales bacterium]|jgi:dihydrofolate synthase/folylpolyglutamate synthase
MTYEEAMAYLNTLSKGTEDARAEAGRLLEHMGNPQDSYVCVHVAGTNGKGSACAFLASILRQAGHRTGLFVSPYVQDFEERIQVEGPILREDLARLVDYVKDKAEEADMPRMNYFAFITAMAYLWFAISEVDVAVIEVGLGGRLDPTNVVNPACCVITSVSMDHENELGEDIASITREKCGIIKNGAPVVCEAQQDEAMGVIDDACKIAMSGLICVDNVLTDVRPIKNGEMFSLQIGKTQLYDLEIPLMGTHQVQNAAAAVLAALQLQKAGLVIEETHIREGLKGMLWPSRLEIIWYNGVRIVLDGAHNPGATAAMRAAYERHGLPQPVLLCAAMGDKDVAGMAATLSGFYSAVVCTKVDNKRGMKVRALSSHFEGKKVALNDPAAALSRACALAGEGGVVVVTGSMYLCGVVRDIIVG